MKLIAIILLVVASIPLFNALVGSVALFVSPELRTLGNNLWVAALLQVSISLSLVVGSAAVLTSSVRTLRAIRIALPLLISLVLLDGFLNLDDGLDAAFLLAVVGFQIAPALVLLLLVHLSLRNSECALPSGPRDHRGKGEG